MKASEELRSVRPGYRLTVNVAAFHACTPATSLKHAPRMLKSISEVNDCVVTTAAFGVRVRGYSHVQLRNKRRPRHASCVIFDCTGLQADEATFDETRDLRVLSPPLLVASRQRSEAANAVIPMRITLNGASLMIEERVERRFLSSLGLRCVASLESFRTRCRPTAKPSWNPLARLAILKRSVWP